MTKPGENFERRPRFESQPPSTESEQRRDYQLMARNELHDFVAAGQNGLKNVESNGIASGLSRRETQHYMQSHGLQRQTEDYGRLGRSFLSRMTRRIELAAAIGLSAVVLMRGTGKEEIAKPDESKVVYNLAKENPQRQAYKDFDSYVKYVDAMGEVEQRSVAEKIEKLRLKREKFEKEAKDSQNYVDKYRELADKYAVEGNIKLNKFYIELAQKEDETKKGWQELASQIMTDEIQAMHRYSKDRYDSTKAISTQGFDAKAKIMGEAFTEADKDRQWVAGVVHSEEYRKKAKEQEQLSDEEIERRKAVVMNKDVHLADTFHELGSDAVGQYARSDSPDADAGQYVVSPEMQAQGRPIAVHELEHAITDSILNMSDYAKKLYGGAYAGPDRNTRRGEYLSNPTEMDARKRVFEHDLEKNGVWKYGETFTDEHYKKAIELYNARKLSPSAEEFLEIVRPSSISTIINTIAKEISLDNSKSEKNT
ncbi:MAG: hypothetical protein A2751_05250 [Candidatus Doudnabacteria bacterium RIFCSPHIGHO2_01_FULL_46_14]|uniref:Uncharacterized protein n=1 Tax=Candidatus Doudnabacteria bacterium RIFCSPHIGHO2_01_FULL_46_14 TaxID=1817824 RepID=A0A1F5NPE7_9BACT|nr:MAG: hypothetical protein A2751_05250 [Candidatus Doudnabacteria bacterium RIFCSPHIGHO2_01_FULL_46_14]